MDINLERGYNTHGSINLNDIVSDQIDSFINTFKDVEIESTYVPTIKTFYLTEEYYNACVNKDRSKIPYGQATREHVKKWLSYFGANEISAAIAKARIKEKARIEAEARIKEKKNAVLAVLEDGPPQRKKKR